jgi:hypothetical protein
MNKVYLYKVSRYKCAKNFFGPNNNHISNQYYHTDSFLGLKILFCLIYVYRFFPNARNSRKIQMNGKIKNKSKNKRKRKIRDQK